MGGIKLRDYRVKDLGCSLHEWSQINWKILFIGEDYFEREQGSNSWDFVSFYPVSAH